MSQSGLIDVESANPQIPTTFVADVGTAIPIANTLEILGATVAAGSIPVGTVASGNTVTTNVQITQAIAATDATKVGLVAFNSSDFVVDANGFVSVSPTAGATQIGVDFSSGTGTNPVLPNGSGVTSFTGGQVAAGTTSNVIRIASLAVNNVAVQIQRSTASASSSTANNGVSSFNSSQFTVDANGFVELLGGGEAIDSFIPDSGTSPVVPSAAGVVTMAGSGSTTTVGGLNSLSFELTGLTNHSVLVGAGTTTITKVGPTSTAGQVLQSAGASADPAFSTATYPSTTTINQLLYSSAANTVTGLATANRAVLTTGATGVPVLTALATNGQLIIGSTAGVPAAATLTAGQGISITNASNGITVASNGATLAWSAKSTDFNATIGNGYFITGNAIATLPSAPSNGDVIAFFVDGSFTVTVTGNTGQTIQISSNVSSAAGTQANTATGDALTLVYRSTNTKWVATSFVGTWSKT